MNMHIISNSNREENINMKKMVQYVLLAIIIVVALFYAYLFLTA